MNHVLRDRPRIEQAIRALPGVVVPPGHGIRPVNGQNYGQGFVEYEIFQYPPFQGYVGGPQGHMHQVQMQHNDAFPFIWQPPILGQPAQQAPPNLFNDNARPSVRNGKDDECVICMEPLAENVVVIDDGTKVDGPVTCGHKFHKDCIQGWVNGKANPKCPACRGNISKIHPASVIGGGKRRSKRKITRRRKSTKRRVRK